MKARRVKAYEKTYDVPFATAVLKIDVKKRDFDNLGWEAGDTVQIARGIQTPVGTTFRIANTIQWVDSKDLKTFRYLPGIDPRKVEIKVYIPGKKNS
jgi:hypothetical protein